MIYMWGQGWLLWEWLQEISLGHTQPEAKAEGWKYLAMPHLLQKQTLGQSKPLAWIVSVAQEEVNYRGEQDPSASFPCNTLFNSEHYITGSPEENNGDDGKSGRSEPEDWTHGSDPEKEKSELRWGLFSNRHMPAESNLWHVFWIRQEWMDSYYRKEDLVKIRKIFAIIQISILPGQVIQLTSLIVFRTGLHTCLWKRTEAFKMLVWGLFQPCKWKIWFWYEEEKNYISFNYSQICKNILTSWTPPSMASMMCARCPSVISFLCKWKLNPDSAPCLRYC